MRTLPKPSATTLETRLSILFSKAASLRLQLCELNKLRYEVSQAELSAAKSRRVIATASCQAGPDTFSEAGPKSEAHHPSPHRRVLPGPSKRRQPAEARAAYCEPKASADVVVLIRKQRPL